MARGVLTVNQISRAGITIPAETTGDATNDHEFANDGKTFILVRNAHATVAKTATFITPGTVDGQAIADVVVSVPATESRYIGPFPPGIYNQGGSAGEVVYVDPESTDIKLTVFRI